MNDSSLSMTEMFESLTSLGNQTKDELRERVSRFQVQLFELNLRRGTLNLLFLNLFKGAWRIGLLVVSVMLVNRYNVNLSIWSWIGVVAMILGAQHLMYAMTIKVTGYIQSLLVSVLDNPTTTAQKFLRAFLMTNTLASFIYIYFLSRIGNYLTSASIPSHIFVIAVVLINPLMIYGLQITFYFLTWLTSVIINRIRDTLFPIATITALMVNTLFLVENYPQSGTSEGLKSFLSSLLENIAKLVQHSLPRRLRGADKSTDSWIRANFSRVATAIRDLKREILITNPGRNELIRNRLGILLENVLRENWDQLDQLEREEKPLGLTLNLTLRLTRNFLFAVAPLLITYCLQVMSIIQPPYIHFFYVFSSAYLILSIISFDPLIKEKLSNLREIAQATKDIGESSKSKSDK